jgi:predicted acylesterase/phospholipase RssA
VTVDPARLAPERAGQAGSGWAVPGQQDPGRSVGADPVGHVSVGPGQRRDIGLALSGGGFRAAAFHLGCLRALHDLDLLGRVQVVSGVSGGALLAALWAYGPAEFGAFDEQAVGLLRRGLQGELVRRALRPVPLARDLTSTAWTLAAGAGRKLRPGRASTTSHLPRLRRPTRTDALAATLAARVFTDRHLDAVTQPGLQVVLTACDLRSSNAVRFGSARSSCSSHGVIIEPVPVATAAAASAAFPLLLPAMERVFTFRNQAGDEQQKVVVLADGGVYDNLALTPLEPGRKPAYTAHVYPVRHVVACDAGRGPLAPAMPHLWPQRVARSFDVVHRRAQDAGRARLHQAAEAGQLDGFVLAYLGMRDERLPVPLADLIPRQRVAGYPTDFRAMPQDALDMLALRGEQLVRTLLAAYCPQLARSPIS